MPGQRRPQGGIQVHTDFAEAALDSGFALIRLAESQRNAGPRCDWQRSLREAEAACIEARNLLRGVPNGAAVRLGCDLERLCSAVAKAKAAGFGAPVRGARVLRMRARW